MKYRKLGRTGFDVSDIAHGLWGMSGWSGSEDQESLQAMQWAIDQGCNFFDTAWAYGEGKSDGLLGKILARNKGKRLYAASKIPPLNGRWPATPEYKYREVFPAAHVVSYARENPRKTRHGIDRYPAVPRVGRQLGQGAGISRNRGEAEKRKADSLLRAEPESLAAREWNRGAAHRPGGYGAGDLQHFRPITGGQAFSSLSRIECRRDRARSTRRRKPGRKNDARDEDFQRTTGARNILARQTSTKTLARVAELKKMVPPA